MKVPYVYRRELRIANSSLQAIRKLFTTQSRTRKLRRSNAKHFAARHSASAEQAWF